MNIRKVMGLPIAWQKSEASTHIFVAEVDGETIWLRLNDFPEEPLCTVIWAEGEQDLDDLASEWTLPKHRGE